MIYSPSASKYKTCEQITISYDFSVDSILKQFSYSRTSIGMVFLLLVDLFRD